MRRRSQGLSILVLFLPLTGCSSATVEPQGSDAKGLAVAFGLPRVAIVGANTSRNTLVESVYGASQLAGMGTVVNTGTVTVTQAGAQYQPSPADKLVVKFGDLTQEFVIRDAAGDATQSTAAGFLQRPHRLSYRHSIPGQAEGDMAVNFDGQGFSATIKGWSVFHGQKYDVDLQVEGRVVTAGGFTADGGGSRTAYQVKGRITHAEFDVDVDERHEIAFESAYSLDLLHSQRGFASRLTATLNNRLRVKSAEYRLDNVQVVTDVMEKGFKSSQGVVSSTGRVLLNGSEFGDIALVGNTSVLRTRSGNITLDLVSGG